MRTSATPSVRHRILLGASFIGSQAIMLTILLGPLINIPWWQGFRNYFANDQLSYAAIAINASTGNFAPVEPLTQTGISHYPSAWYLILGASSAITGQPVHRMWTILGLIAIGTGLAFLGWLAYRLSRLPVAPLLPGLALLTGTLSTLTSQWWYSSLSNHAVIWGPFGTFFTLNAEAVGLMLVAIVVGLVLIAAIAPRASALVIATAAVMLGGLANVQTYAFLTGTSLVVIMIAVLSLFKVPSRARLMASAVLLVTALMLGPWLASLIGPLPLFLLTLATALPAAWPLLTQNPRLTILGVTLFALAAAPQVARTVIGIAAGDDFLTYRQESTDGLGVHPVSAVIAPLPLILIGLFNAVMIARQARSNERTAFGALLIALGFGALLMAANDRWGFEQEPYRFWLQYSIVGGLALSVITAWSVSRWRGLERQWRIATATIGLLAATTWIVSLLDVRSFSQFAQEQGVLVIEDERGRALQRLIAPNDGLVLSSRCLDPQLLKLITGPPVVTFNRGLAWPDNRSEIDALLQQSRDEDSDPQALARLGIRVVLTDSACQNDWSFTDARVQPIDVADYPGGTFTGWRVQP